MFKHFFDPDRNWKSWDKAEHAAAGLLICALLTLFVSHWIALGVTIALGAAFELGQYDTARSTYVEYEHGDIDRTYEIALGNEGYGFGLLDLAADTAGALLWLAIVLVATIF